MIDSRKKCHAPAAEDDSSLQLSGLHVRGASWFGDTLQLPLQYKSCALRPSPPAKPAQGPEL
jgi:hypothetical protein